MTRWLRLIYSIEFLIALIVVFLGWPEIGGQSHMDYIDWRWKASLAVGFAIAVVCMTRSITSNERAWNAGSILWLLLAVALAAGMGLLSYRAHLEEDSGEEPDARHARLTTPKSSFTGVDSRPPHARATSRDFLGPPRPASS